MPESLETAEPLSWRDPDGFVVHAGGRILRSVVQNRAAEVRTLLSTAWMARLIAEGSIPRTHEVPSPELVTGPADACLWLEHQKLQFPCYPHEITALQLYDAGQLTLRVAIEAAEQGWGLKDASAWNVLYARGRPVFVDILSFEPLKPTGTWIAYGQFARHFLLPLLLYLKLGVTPPEVFLTQRDGVTPEHASQLLRGRNILSRLGIELVLLPRWLSGRGSRVVASDHKPRLFHPDIASQLLLRTLRRLQRSLERLRPVDNRSQSLWSGYEESRPHYTEADLMAKREFVQRGLGTARHVLDLGCNAGEFSLLAADGDRSVVAADADHLALSRLYERIRARGIPVTPVMLNIGRPTPAVGWENREVDAFLARSVGRFDCILVLGLVHHLLVSERVTLPMLVELLHRLNPRCVLFEWVGPEDERFQQVAGLNRALYADLNAAMFENIMSHRFTLSAKLVLPYSSRVMYQWDG